MIESVFRKRHPQTGILYVLINTKERWVYYQVGFTAKHGTIPIAFYPSEKKEILEFVEMGDGFDCSDYVVTSVQNKDQITVVCVPARMLLDDFVEYKNENNGVCCK